ncbi:hypothetical protein D9615_004312 [Tricholomella constricta]|uniref:Uncharacterized protein n=1 Tax=Tricholomella constricta TaxID=117010 RepID=A0A8H5HEI2_9AGAR|nr:hypothetical protein D9615_004312 [Tricholomella constricta]
MPLSVVQLSALLQAKQILDDVGLNVHGASDDPDALQLSTFISDNMPQSPSAEVQLSQYEPPIARSFSEKELLAGINHINRLTTVDALIDHPLNAIVEYPQTGSCKGESVAHRFVVDPTNFVHPKFNIQYSLGDGHGGHSDVFCGLLVNRDGTRAYSKHLRTSCKGLKYCSAAPSLQPLDISHFFTSRHELPLFSRHSVRSTGTADEEVFMKTLAFFCAIQEKGCGFDASIDLDGDFTICNVPEGDNDASNFRGKERNTTCRGRLLFQCDKYSQWYIQCAKRDAKNLDHLVLRNIDEFNLEYLAALMSGDAAAVMRFELPAKQFGYGPLAPCTFVASPTKSILAQTPPILSNLLESLFRNMGWKLADVTPRKALLDSNFMFALRKHLGWQRLVDPTLSDLHPSLGNLDYVRRHIDVLRAELFPSGTGWSGALHLLSEHNTLPLEERYVRCVEAHTIEKNKEFRLVICMSPAMSCRLLKCKRPTIDTSFKRLHGWQEFEIETWDAERMRSVVVTRAFTTSQSAEAHCILFRRLFEIATADTGLPVQFYYIHGDGFETWIADAHKGQALGLGRFCQLLCQPLDRFCRYDGKQRLRDLDPYEHLRRFFRICITHFKRNINDIRRYISKDVRIAMLSLASSQPHACLEETLRFIEAGGQKAKAWLNDKRTGSKFVLPAVYQPMSLIPIQFWKASASTSNGNEQAHRNINRDGINLTMLAGIMRGMQYDGRAMASLELHASLGVNARDQAATHYRRMMTSVGRQITVQRRMATAKSEKESSHDTSPSKRRRTSALQTRPTESVDLRRDTSDISTTHSMPSSNTLPMFDTHEPSPTLHHWDTAPLPVIPTPASHGEIRPYHDLHFSTTPDFDALFLGTDTFSYGREPPHSQIMNRYAAYSESDIGEL